MIDPINDKFREECGVFGIFSKGNLDVSRITYYGLYALQHRGQESAGIAVSDGEGINLHKGLGLITESFKEEHLDKLKGNIAIGHVRYSTTGSIKVENAQPLLSSYKLGSIATAGRIGQYTQKAADFGTAAARSMSNMAASQNLFQLSTTIFNAAGGFGAFKTTPPPAATTG